MAFSATIRNQAYLGPGIRKLFGTWTGSSGDAAGTMTVSRLSHLLSQYCYLKRPARYVILVFNGKRSYSA